MKMKTLYPVNDAYVSIQGEGSLGGVPMIVLRLHGCPVGCSFCDTKETWSVDENQRRNTFLEARGQNPYWCQLTAEEIRDILLELVKSSGGKGPSWVLLTGGEPALYQLGELITVLQQNWRVSIETSGTADGHVGTGIDWVCVSPKIGMPGKRPILPNAVTAAHELKFVIGRQRDLDTVRTFLETHNTEGKTICLQPMSCAARATALCIQTCQQEGWRLSLQTHKYLEIR